MAFFAFSCDAQPTKEIVCNDVIRIYKEQGYHVWHEERTEDFDHVCVVKAYKEDENNYIYFTFFEDAEQAKYFAQKRDTRGLFYLFSALFGNANWHHAKQYGQIVIEYEDKTMYQPFQTLIQ